jgi:Spy/CpxP family protein refolding chaperone
MMPAMRVLTDEQRESLRDAMRDQREKMQPIEEKLLEARKDLLQAGLVEKFDEDAIRAKALKVAKMEAELAVLRAKAFSQIKPPLTPDQIEEIKNLPVMSAGAGRGLGRPAARGDGPDQPRRQFQRPPPGERDGNDLPPKPKADQ